jgi:hypothetical protein
MKKIIIILISLVLMTSCTTDEEFSAIKDPQDSTELIKDTNGTNGVLIPITSSNVMAAGYDAQSQIMKVQFKNGRLYEYYGVDLDLWNSFVSAQPNPWSAVGNPRLVGEGYQYRRIS